MATEATKLPTYQADQARPGHLRLSQLPEVSCKETVISQLLAFPIRSAGQ